MAVSQSDIDKLTAAIAQGVRVVRFQDRTVEYQSTEDMLKALTFLTSQVTSNPPRRRQTLVYTRSGW